MQHRTQDFSFILDGVLGIMEQQIVITNNILPGARKSIPYVAENSTSIFEAECARLLTTSS
jgi:hypothetical protein